jgi:nucleoside-diphosphate-sugar epimerase
MDPTVLITGGNGFIGAHLGRRLALHGYQVCSFDLAAPSPETAFIRRDAGELIFDVVGNVTAVGELSQVIRDHAVSHIVHTAAVSDPVRSVEEPYQTYALNAMGTAAVCEAGRAAGVARVIVISSNAVYAARQYEPIDERHATTSIETGNQHAHYGASKIISEIIALTYTTWNQLDAVVLRLSAVYGFGMRGSLYIRPMVERALAGMPVRIDAGGDMRRDYTYVEDAASAIVAALDADAAGLSQRVFNVSGGHAYKASELPEVIRKVLPEADIAIGGGLDPHEVRDARTRGTLNLKAAFKDLGYAPEWTLEQGVKDYVRALQAFQTNGGDRGESKSSERIGER